MPPSSPVNSNTLINYDIKAAADTIKDSVALTDPDTNFESTRKNGESSIEDELFDYRNEISNPLPGAISLIPTIVEF